MQNLSYSYHKGIKSYLARTLGFKDGNFTQTNNAYEETPWVIQIEGRDTEGSGLIKSMNSVNVVFPPDFLLTLE